MEVIASRWLPPVGRLPELVSDMLTVFSFRSERIPMRVRRDPMWRLAVCSLLVTLWADVAVAAPGDRLLSALILPVLLLAAWTWAGRSDRAGMVTYLLFLCLIPGQLIDTIWPGQPLSLLVLAPYAVACWKLHQGPPTV